MMPDSLLAPRLCVYLPDFRYFPKAIGIYTSARYNHIFFPWKLIKNGTFSSLGKAVIFSQNFLKLYEQRPYPLDQPIRAETREPAVN